MENAGVDRTDGKCRSGKYRSDNVWKAVKQKIKSHLQFHTMTASCMWYVYVDYI